MPSLRSAWWALLLSLCRPGDLDGPGRGAMQAIDRAVIVGERSAGICVVADLMQLPNGATFMYHTGTQRDNRKSR